MNQNTCVYDSNTKKVIHCTYYISLAFVIARFILHPELSLSLSLSLSRLDGILAEMFKVDNHEIMSFLCALLYTCFYIKDITHMNGRKR